MQHKYLIRGGGLTLIALAIALLPGCNTWDGHFSILGYTTRPMYDLGIRTVRVPIFKNLTMERGLEFQLTEAVVREIEAKTPYKVVQGEGCADTELIGTIVNRTKALINPNQLGETRVAEVTLAVELVWRDLRVGVAGGILSQPLPGKPGDPLPPPPPIGAPAPPVLTQGIRDFAPELGEGLASAQKGMVDRLAVQIVSMMEKPW
ncbi:MAG TPA: LPS assembly lipoprotein LptE [Gemmataceae bacterium]|nr:LPS assembly lipoprotein LptE [Gemmataceae bacterium]